MSEAGPARTTSTGFGVARDLNNAVTGNQDAQLSFRNAGLATEVGLIGYEMTLLVERFASVLTPALIAELQGSLTLT